MRAKCANVGGMGKDGDKINATTLEFASPYVKSTKHGVSFGITVTLTTMLQHK